MCIHITIYIHVLLTYHSSCVSFCVHVFFNQFLVVLFCAFVPAFSNVFPRPRMFRSLLIFWTLMIFYWLVLPMPLNLAPLLHWSSGFDPHLSQPNWAFLEFYQIFKLPLVWIWVIHLIPGVPLAPGYNILEEQRFMAGSIPHKSLNHTCLYCTPVRSLLLP